MPKVTEEYRAARRDEIADAALRAFRRKGFQATSMAEIIAEAGLSAGAIYGHYPSKSSIVVDVATRVIDARIHDIEHLSELTPMPPPPALPRILVGGMLESIGSPKIMVQLWGEGMTDPEIGSLAANVLERLRTTLTRYVSQWLRNTLGTEIKFGGAEFTTEAKPAQDSAEDIGE